MANMVNKVTTVSFYDTLGVESIRYCVDQTKLTTIACTIDCANNLAKIKKDEMATGGSEMETLSNLIIFGKDHEAFNS